MHTFRLYFYRSPADIFQAALLALILMFSTHTQAQVIKVPTKLDITMSATGDVNPNEQGQASPIMVRMYELKSDKTFKQADFSALQNNDKTTLGADLLVKDEFILRPNGSRTIRRTSYADTTAIGVIAAYRDKPHATWREVYTLREAPEASWWRSFLPDPKAKLRIEVRSNYIHISDKDGK